MHIKADTTFKIKGYLMSILHLDFTWKQCLLKLSGKIVNETLKISKNVLRCRNGSYIAR